MEIWRDIKGYEGIYQVSSEGRIKSLRRVDKSNHIVNEKIKDTIVNKYGYEMVTLWLNGSCKTLRVHRLVAEAFIPNPENKPCIDHINTIKTDNRVVNLKWASSKENCNNPISKQHLSNALKGNTNSKYGKMHHNSKKVYQYDKEGNFIREWDTVSDVARQLGVSQGNISSCCMGLRCTAYGFIWKYAA